MKSNVVETVTGAVVIVVAVAFFTFVYKTADVRAGSGGYELVAQFDKIDGITVGSDVRILGIKVGSVVEQVLDVSTLSPVVTMTIAPYIKLPADSSAKITSDGLLGSRFISIEPGGSENSLGPNGIIEHTQGPIDIWDMIGRVLFDQGK